MESTFKNGYQICECGGLMVWEDSIFLGEDTDGHGRTLSTHICEKCGQRENEVLIGG